MVAKPSGVVGVSTDVNAPATWMIVLICHATPSASDSASRTPVVVTSVVSVTMSTAPAPPDVVSDCTLAKNPPLARRNPPAARMLNESATVGVKSASSLSAKANTPDSAEICTLRPKAAQ